MSVVVAMLRGVNIVGKRQVKMETLRALCASLKCSDAVTHLQSGNVVFRTRAKNLEALRIQMQEQMADSFGFDVPTVFRTVEDLRKVVATNPFPERVEAEASKMLVTFLYDDPGLERRKALRSMTFEPEEVKVEGRELYVYYPTGQGLSKLRFSPIEKALGTSGTSRNWNTVLKLLEIAEAMQYVEARPRQSNGPATRQCPATKQ